MKRQIRTPYLVVNPKAYLYGQKSLELALAADQASEDFDIDIFFTTNFADLRLIKENTKNIILTAQHMQSLRPGRGMGHVLPESLVDAGAEAVFLNHAENPLTVNELYACVKDVKSWVCIRSPAPILSLRQRRYAYLVLPVFLQNLRN